MVLLKKILSLAFGAAVAAADTAASDTENPRIDCKYMETSVTQKIRTLPIPDQSMWKKLRETYRLALADSQEVEFPSSDNESDIRVPYEVRQSPGKGRGIFATARVQRGDPIEGRKNAAVFQNEREFKRFLSLLSHDLACNVINWAYPARDSKVGASKDTYVMNLHMDDSVFFNEAGEGGAANIGCMHKDVEEDESPCLIDGTNVYALRDIEAGEELLLNYEEFDLEGVEELTWWLELYDDAVYDGDWGAELNALYTAEKKRDASPHKEL